MNKLSKIQANVFKEWIVEMPKRHVILSVILKKFPDIDSKSIDIMSLCRNITGREHWIAISKNIDKGLPSMPYERVCVLLLIEDGKCLLYSFHNDVKDFKDMWHITYEPRRVLLEKTFRGRELEKTRMFP